MYLEALRGRDGLAWELDDDLAWYLAEDAEEFRRPVVTRRYASLRLFLEENAHRHSGALPKGERRRTWQTAGRKATARSPAREPEVVLGFIFPNLA